MNGLKRYNGTLCGLIIGMIALALLAGGTRALAQADPASILDRLRQLEEIEGEPMVELPPGEIEEQPVDVGDVLLGSLKGITLFKDTRKELADEPDETGIELDSGVHIIGIQPPEPEALRQMIQSKYINQPTTLRDLNELVVDIIKFYREHDRPITDVYIPQQDITGEVVKLAVNEARLGDVTIRNEGKAYYGEEYIFGRMDLPVGEIINAQDIRLELENVNSSPWSRIGKPSGHPFRKVTASFTPGEEIGLSDLVISVEDKMPLKWFVGYENSGTQIIGANRWILGGVYYNMWGLDHQLGLQLLGGFDWEAFHGIVANYKAPLPWGGHSWEIFGAWAKSDVELPGSTALAFEQSGTSWLLGTRYWIPLPGIEPKKASKGDSESGGKSTVGDIAAAERGAGFGKGVREEQKLAATRRKFSYYHGLGIGADFKRLSSDLFFGGAMLFESAPEIFQLAVDYEASETDRFGATRILLQGLASPGNVTNNNDTAVFEEARPLARSDYYYGRLRVEREFDLPYGMLFRADMTGQLSSENLLASEQLGLGGYDTVRGYEEREVRGDKGWVVRLEIYSPPVSLAGLVAPAKDIQDEFRILGFYDMGAVQNVHLLEGEEPSYDLASVGFGMRYTFNRSFTFRLDWGWVMQDTGISLQDEPSRVHVGAQMNF